MPSRRGSFLLFSVALVGVMVAFGFALLQTVRLSSDAGTSSQRQWFAQEAAIAGLHHSMENIALDYRSVHRSATYLDGIWHRDFHPLGLDQNQPESASVSADDDVRNEHILWQPILERNDRGYWEYTNGYGSFGDNMYQARGRARYYEVGYYEPSDPTYANPARPNLAATRFTDAGAPVPSRATAIFLDAQLRRIVPASGESADSVRARARYRLRYAVLTTDASAALLVNPALDVDYRDAWSPGTAASSHGAVAGDDTYADAHYAAYGAAFAPTALGRRLERYGHSLVDMLATSGSAGERGAYFRLEHVFKLRGVSTNTAVDAQGWPVAFPNMLRLWRLQTAPSTFQVTVPWLTSVAPASSGMGLFRNDVSGGQMRLEGGQSIVGKQDGADFYLSHALTGPQYSYRNIQTAVNGGTMDIDWGHGDPVQTRTLATPFGRAGEKGTASGPAQWNRGPTDVPWQVNVLTAPPGTIRAMIGGYMPAQFRTMLLRYQETRSSGVTYTALDTSISAAGRLDGAYEMSMFKSYGRNLFTDFMSPAFKRWPAPKEPPQAPASGAPYAVPPYTAIPGHADLYPNYFVLDQRAPEKVYPGLYASLGLTAPATAMEDTGRLYDASDKYCENSSGYDRLMAYDSHSNGLFFPGSPRKYEDWGVNRYARVPMHGNLPIADSFFWDMSAAFGMAISVMRMHWLEVSNPWAKLPVLFPDGKAAFADMDSLEDLDRLFLKQLGIDMAAPGSATVVKSWGYYDVPAAFPRRLGMDRVQLNHNIRSLVNASLLNTGTYTSVQRARCMEMMLNDWRMSFLGASPDYPGFRPLDFDGDGQVICSAYSASGSYGDDASGVTWPRRAVDMAPGRGPAVDPASDHPFSLTGCFTMRKSRYFRVITRGELWDCQLARPVSNATMESVLCVDPNGRSAAGKLGADFSVLHQRWYWNSYNALLPSIYP